MSCKKTLDIIRAHGDERLSLKFPGVRLQEDLSGMEHICRKLCQQLKQRHCDKTGNTELLFFFGSLHACFTSVVSARLRVCLHVSALTACVLQPWCAQRLAGDCPSFSMSFKSETLNPPGQARHKRVTVLMRGTVGSEHDSLCRRSGASCVVTARGHHLSVLWCTSSFSFPFTCFWTRSSCCGLCSESCQRRAS